MEEVFFSFSIFSRRWLACQTRWNAKLWGCYSGYYCCIFCFSVWYSFVLGVSRAHFLHGFKKKKILDTVKSLWGNFSSYMVWGQLHIVIPLLDNCEYIFLMMCCIGAASVFPLSAVYPLALNEHLCIVSAFPHVHPIPLIALSHSSTLSWGYSFFFFHICPSFSSY